MRRPCLSNPKVGGIEVLPSGQWAELAYHTQTERYASEGYSAMEQERDLEREDESDEHSTLEAYKITLEELHRLSNDHFSTLARLQSICLVLLGAEAYLAATSQLTSWLPVLTVFGISAFGLVYVRSFHQRDVEDTIRRTACMVVGTKLERKLVEAGILDYGLLLYAHTLLKKAEQTRAGKHKDTKVPRRKMLVNSRQIFRVAFTIIPLAFALLTFLALNPATHALVQPLLPPK